MRVIRCVNHSRLISQAEFSAGISALQVQVWRDFYPAWGDVAYLEVSQSAGPGEEVIYYQDRIDVANAFGYHTVAGESTPVGFVDVALCLAYGDRWTATGSHETLEQLLDPTVNYLWYAPWEGRMAALAAEVVDPTENSEYVINGFAVSNFVLPRWAIAGKLQAGERVDFMGELSAPLTLSRGGYQAYTYDMQQWQQTFAEHVPQHQRTRLAHSRSASRFASPSRSCEPCE